MPRASVTAENAALAGIFAASPPTASATSWWTSLHTADTGTTGASEYAGVTRVQFSCGSPSAGIISNTATATFTTSGATAVTHTGQYNNATNGSGTFQIGAPLSASVTATTITFAVGALSYGAS
jgi:hypothetical protein